MIKFFRQIRKSLLEQNQMGKYFKYAIGEILLVVIGILIALQINNWNEESNERLEEQVILKSLLNAFIGNKEAFLSAKIRAGNHMLAIEKAFEYTGRDVSLLSRVKSDSIMNSFSNYVSADIDKGFLNDLLNTGRIHLIQNDTIKQLLNGWSAIYTDEVLETEQAIFQRNISTYLPFEASQSKAIKNSTLKYFGVTSGFTQDYKAIYYNQEFENLLIQKLSSYQGCVRGYDVLIRYNDIIISILNKELQND